MRTGFVVSQHMGSGMWSVMFYSYCKYLRLEIRCKTTIFGRGQFVFPPILNWGLQPLSVPVGLLNHPDLTFDSFNVLMQQWGEKSHRLHLVKRLQSFKGWSTILLNFQNYFQSHTTQTYHKVLLWEEKNNSLYCTLGAVWQTMPFNSMGIFNWKFYWKCFAC